jgi:hypothetical protein
MNFSRRDVVRGSGVLLAAHLSSRQAVAQQKVTRLDAKYQEQPHGQQRCGICLQFQPPGSCRLVEGTIVPQGWCQFFAARENAR